MPNRLDILAYIRNFRPYERVTYPVNGETVRRLGYRSDKHFTVIGSVKKGNKRHANPKKGRSPKSFYSVYSSRLSGLQIAKGRAAKKHPGHRVVQGYYLCHHAGKKYYQLIVTA